MLWQICPICVGVAGTWLWMLGAYFSGASIDPLVIAFLMGGSIVGIAYTLEKRLATDRSPVAWKTLFVPSGFIALYGLLTRSMVLGLFGIVLAGLVLVVFFLGKKNKIVEKKTVSEQARELEEKMKNCC